MFLSTSILRIAHARTAHGHTGTDSRTCTLVHAQVLYVGIIDFLTQFGKRKGMEYVSCSMAHCGANISTTPPHKYAQRFVEFVEDITVT